MSDNLVFAMGEYEALFPTDRQYSKNHMWAQPSDDVYRCGFTAYAVRLLQDVYFLEWCIDEGSVLRDRQQIGAIESKKAESDLFAPMAGRLLQFNEQLLEDPSAINVAKYGEGWLFEIAAEDPSLLSPEDYVDYLHSVWEVTQRTIKGQLN
jgi:glycine cleavage system H protein